MNSKKSVMFLITMMLIAGVTGTGMAYDDPTYGTGNPKSYQKKKTGKSQYAYPSDFNDPYYGSGNPPGYNQRKAKEQGKIYIDGSHSNQWPDPTYGTGNPPGYGSKRSYRRR